MGYSAIATPAVLLSAVIFYANYPANTPVENLDEDIALFTHARGELHCPDRELRHLCVPELRRFVEEGEGARDEAYTCVKSVLEEHADDYYMLKNMTHLLLDLDGNIHVFDRGDRNSDFIDLGMEFGRTLMHHPECLSDFDELDPYQCRCYPLYAKILILKLKNAGRWDAARELFDEASKMSWNGAKNTFGPGEAISWNSFNQTPQIWLPELRAVPVWPRDTWDAIPIAAKLEEHYETILKETNLVMQHGDYEWSPTYRFLFDDGDWSQVLLYNGGEWQPECDQVFPETCKLLRQWLPSKPGLPWVSDQNEQVLLLKMTPGTTVERHSGPSNSILNIHLGIKGLKNAVLEVDGEHYGWEEGKVVAWDGSFDHTINCIECPESRVIMMVRYMHPEVTLDHFKGHTRTHFQEIDQSLFD